MHVVGLFTYCRGELDGSLVRHVFRSKKRCIAGLPVGQCLADCLAVRSAGSDVDDGRLDPIEVDQMGPPVIFLLRTRADRSGVGAPAVGPFDEFDGDDEGDGERELGEALVQEPVGVAAELTEVRQPAVGAFHGPAQP